jgi:hypothetical protein
MPAVPNSANDGRRYDARCHHNRRSRYDYDRLSVGSTSAVGPTVKAQTTSTLSIGTVNGDK